MASMEVSKTSMIEYGGAFLVTLSKTMAREHPTATETGCSLFGQIAVTRVFYHTRTCLLIVLVAFSFSFTMARPAAASSVWEDVDVRSFGHIMSASADVFSMKTQVFPRGHGLQVLRVYTGWIFTDMVHVAPLRYGSNEVPVNEDRNVIVFAGPAPQNGARTLTRTPTPTTRLNVGGVLVLKTSCKILSQKQHIHSTILIGKHRNVKCRNK